MLEVRRVDVEVHDVHTQIPSSFTSYLDHGYKRHDSLHVFLQFRQGSQFACYHFVVWKNAIFALKKTPGSTTKSGQTYSQTGTETERDVQGF